MRHLWTSRFVVITAVVLLAASAIFAIIQN